MVRPARTASSSLALSMEANMSAFIVICAILVVFFWRSVLKIAVILAVALMMFGVLAIFEGIHYVIR
jgi:hypothetical protein